MNIKKLKKKVKKKIKKIVIACYRQLTKILPVSKDVILFESNLGRNYTGNPKAIYEKMVEMGLDKKYRLIWILNDPSEKIIGQGKR